MSRFKIKVIASGLAALYGACAILGYGLHGFVACDESYCTEMACRPAAHLSGACGTAVDTGCRHDHGEPEVHHIGNRTKPLGPAVEFLKRRHDPSTCSVCALLAQLRVGYTVTDLQLEWSYPPVEFQLEFESAFSRPSIRLGEPRGPPFQAV